MVVRRPQLIALIIAVISLPSVTEYVRTGALPNHFTLALVAAVAIAAFVMSE